MTAKDFAFLSERRRNFRRNITRYAYTQSFNRLAGRATGFTRPARELHRARAALLLLTAAFVGIGTYFVIF